MAKSRISPLRRSTILTESCRQSPQKRKRAACWRKVSLRSVRLDHSTKTVSVQPRVVSCFSNLSAAFCKRLASRSTSPITRSVSCSGCQVSRCRRRRIQPGFPTRSRVGDTTVFRQSSELRTSILGERQRTSPGLGIPVLGGIQPGNNQAVWLDQQQIWIAPGK